jgi:hypothetical protein
LFDGYVSDADSVILYQVLNVAGKHTILRGSGINSQIDARRIKVSVLGQTPLQGAFTGHNGCGLNIHADGLAGYGNDAGEQVLHRTGIVGHMVYNIVQQKKFSELI